MILDRHVANVSYTLSAGPRTQFGKTTVEGLKDVEEAVVLQELIYKPGEQFSGTALRTTEKNLRELDLFSQIVIEPQPLLPIPLSRSKYALKRNRTARSVSD